MSFDLKTKLHEHAGRHSDRQQRLNAMFDLVQEHLQHDLDVAATKGTVQEALQVIRDGMVQWREHREQVIQSVS